MAPMKPLASVIPTEGLSEVSRDESTDYSKSCSENEAFGLIFAARRNEFGNHSGNEADNDSPDNAEHVLIPPVMIACHARYLLPFCKPCWALTAMATIVTEAR
jgi:hypothetical protein